MSKARRVISMITTIVFCVTAGLDLALAIRRTVEQAHRDAARRTRAAQRSRAVA